jgi:hypothetical protein
MTEEWVDTAYTGGDPGPPDGPVVDMTVVGLGRTTADFGRWVGIMHVSPAFIERYGDQLRTYRFLEAELTDDALAAAIGGNPPPIELEGQFSPFFDREATDGALSAIATALRLVAVAAAIAGSAAIAILLTRVVAIGVRHREVLSALGWTMRRQRRAAAAAVVPAVIGAVIVGLVAGVLLSPLAVVGLAADVDPDETSVIVADGELIAVGAVSLVGLVALAFAAVTLAVKRRPHATTARPRGLQIQSPLPVTLGVRHALFGRAERGGRTSRGAVAAAVVATAGAIAALVVSASIANLERDPTLSGATAGRAIDSGEATDVQDRALARLEPDDDVAMLATVDISFDVTIDGNDTSVLIYDILRGRLEPSLTSGRLALQSDEVTLGPRTIERLGVGVGDEVSLEGPLGEATYRVVGAVLFPEGDFEHDDGVAMPRSASDRIVDLEESTDIHQVVFDWADDVDATAADAALRSEGFTVFTDDEAVAVPGAVRNLGEVESLPRWFALFIGLLAAVSLAHALSVALRLRRRELNTIRALGVTRAGNASIVGVHAWVIAIVGVAIGLPLGLIAGTQLWRSIAENAHVVVAVRWPWRSIGSVVLLTAALLCVLTLVSGIRAARLRPADDLRTG